MSPARSAILQIHPRRREVLDRVAFDSITRPEDARRAQFLLRSAQGVTNDTLAEEFSISPTTARS